jgi:hypothetical protein
MKESNKNNPFKTPEGYFDNLKDRLLDTMNKEKINLPEKDGFSIPNGYFDGLHENIQKKLDEKETKVVQLNPWKKYYAVAASIAAIAIVFLGFNWNTSKNSSFEDLAETDIESYFETIEYDMSAYELAEVLPLDELEINDILTNSFNEEHMLDYLNENIEDLETFNLDENE